MSAEKDNKIIMRHMMLCYTNRLYVEFENVSTKRESFINANFRDMCKLMEAHSNNKYYIYDFKSLSNYMKGKTFTIKDFE
jgi:hypothetical protein